VPAVAVATKPGHLFFLNRETGAPIFPVEERPVPASDIPGEADCLKLWNADILPAFHRALDSRENVLR